ncbi:tyrosine-type recombinase/integrase [Endozoicomonas euniceicola]|uniref:Tyrosine-type recombinase/integrase n=1 Tax=Endozoicomonas euniceicola TaxID=1234143 RepID=A0ABY6GNQ2_9GAMM|nr:tyrosine-type recombinase/integrase [Endozoicomonas euniceicola]UYM14295.1 tyrosine-type recombinase/integrase [Endozoicomonas euniceicola]
MATFEKRKHGWFVRVQKKGVREGRTFDTRTDAKAWADKREKEIDDLGSNAGEVAEASRNKVSLKEVMERYIKEVSSKKEGAQSFKRERQRFAQMAINPEHWPLNELMDTLVADIEPHHIGEWKTTRLNFVKPGTVRRERNFLSHVFTMAVEWGYIKETPFGKKVKFNDLKDGERDRGVADSEIEEMIFALDDWDGKTKPATTRQVVALLWSLCLETAMRLQEAQFLTLEEVDLKNGVIDLPAHRCKEKRKKTLGLSTRAIDLLNLGKDSGGNYWFGDATAKIAVSSVFSHASNKTDIDDLQFRDSRHEALTRLAEKLEPFELARQAGHTNMNRTLKYYRKTAREFGSKLRR